ncbi:MFS transporter [Parasphingopyxis sp.]|uniref:MFS transporter n=1 Tax=Parasphingopyxis sp. TaxID=1920299 RepID=UPI002617F367|nr:MFS transporter [Parasphingopyxis sp.]
MADAHTETRTHSRSGPTIWSLIAFGSPGVAATLLISPVYSILPTYYAMNTNVTLAQIGVVFLVARIADAFTDPLVGVLSDRTRSRLGARLPWMIAGAVMAVPSAFLLFLPPGNATAIYFFIWSFLAMSAWTLLSIPHNAWAAELTDDYDERSRIFGIKNAMATLGGFAFFLLPPILAPFTGTTEIEGSVMLAFVIVLAVLIPLSVVWASFKAPIKSTETKASMPPSSLWTVFRSFKTNKPFVNFFAVSTISGIAVGMTSTLSFLYIQDYMQLGAYFFVIGVLAPVVAIISVPFWLRVSRRYSKHKAWSVGMGISGSLGLFILLLEPGPQALIPLLVLTGVSAVMQGALIPLPPSILGDVADYEAWKENTNATGNYFAILVLMAKVTAAVGSSLALLISGALGYIPNTDSPEAWALLIPLAVIPFFLQMIAAVISWYFPIDRRRQATIAKRLEQRKKRALAATVS